MKKLLINTIFVLLSFKWGYNSDTLGTMISKLKKSQIQNGKISFKEENSDYYPENCSLIYFRIGSDIKFSGLLCFKMNIYFSESLDDENNLLFQINKIYLAYAKINGENKKFNQTDTLESSYTIVVDNLNPWTWFKKHNYNFFILETKQLQTNENIKEIEFLNRSTIYRTMKDTVFSYLNKYKECFRSREDVVPFTIGRINLDFRICEEMDGNVVLHYDSYITQNYIGGPGDLRSFDIEKFNDKNFVEGIWKVLNNFVESSGEEKNDFEIISYPTEEEYKILKKEFKGIFGIKDEYENIIYGKSSSRSKPFNILVKRKENENKDSKVSDGDGIRNNDNSSDSNSGKSRISNFVLYFTLLVVIVGLIVCLVFFFYSKKIKM